MKYFSFLLSVFLFSSISVFSQEKVIKHTVSKGETISEIADKYNIKPSAIYALNPKAKKGIKFHAVLLIPTESKKKQVINPTIVTKYSENTHEVLSKETLYGIAKQYNISVEDLYKINPNLEKEGLKQGDKINVPQMDLQNLVSASTSKKEPQKTDILEKAISKKEVVVSPKLTEKTEIFAEGIVREVLPKETLYSIARQYGIKFTDLQKANSELGSKALKVGQKIIVPVKSENNSNLIVKAEMLKTEKDIVILPQPVIENKPVESETTHEVLPKETKYGIAKEYGISIAELEEQNPKIVKELLVGYKLKIRSSKLMETSVSTQEVVVKNQVGNADSDKIVNTAEHDSTFVDQLISKASENIGTRYRTGGTTTEGFDCSGLMCYTFSSYDIKLPRSSIEMSSYGSRIDTGNAQKGDLIFFKTNGRRQINHVGMVVEVCGGEIKFIHSSNHGGVIISSTKESYYERNLVQINRVL